MLSRGFLLAISALALAGCQAYPPSEADRLAAAATKAGVPLGVAAPPPKLSAGSFRDVDPHEGEVGFWNEDPVKKRAVAGSSSAYVEWLTLKNGGLFVYERLDDAPPAATSDAELLRADLALPAWRERGISYDVAQLNKIGPFTYLAQSSSRYNCFIFHGRPLGGTGQAYGNVCYIKPAKDLVATKSEMVDILSHVRFAPHETSHAAADIAAPAPSPAAAAASPVTVNLEQCRHSVSFSGAPSLKDAEPSQPGVTRTAYRFEEGAYSEEAVCLCKANFDYSKVSQFDAVDHVKENAEKSDFTLEKASFADGGGGGKELDYEARHNFRNMFLLGRNSYQQCGLYTKAIGTTYADTLRAKKFIAWATTPTPETAPKEAAAQPPTVITPPSPPQPAAATTGEGAAAVAGSSTPVISAAPGAPAEAMPAVPRTPVGEAELPAPAKKAADAQVAAAPNDAAKPATVVSISEKLPQDSPATRLRRLQELFDQKLITQSEYEGKRKAILDTL
jgi:hypothetical protein